MVSFTVGLAREVSAQGIRVNAVATGLVHTEMVAKTWEDDDEIVVHFNEIQQKHINTNNNIYSTIQ
jgi:NAD(P)-dependent dehydrogenase (short-subunit alcohol dehydrogenase family)